MEFNVEEKKEVSYDGPKKLKPGVSAVTITGVADGVNKNGKPYIAVGFVDNEGGGHTADLYMTEAAMPFSTQKLQRIAKAVGQDLVGNSNTEALNKMLTGKRGFIKLKGKEAIIQSGEFAGKKIVVAEYAAFVGEDKPDTLTFNPDTDIERLPETGIAEKATNDLPF